MANIAKPPFADHVTRVFFSGQGRVKRAPGLRDGLLAAHSRFSQKRFVSSTRKDTAHGRMLYSLRTLRAVLPGSDQEFGKRALRAGKIERRGTIEVKCGHAVQDSPQIVE